MKSGLTAVAIILGLSGAALAGPHLAATKDIMPSAQVENVRFNHVEARSFRRCMRAKYGPRYFRGVRQAQRNFKAQACGG